MIVTKAQLMAQVAADIAHESFDHTVQGTFDITLMRSKAIAEQRRPFHTDINQAVIDWLYTYRDVDEERVRTLTLEQQEEPGIIVRYNDGQDLLIDGIHRMVARWRRDPALHFYFWEFAEAEIIRPSSSWVSAKDLNWGKFDIINGQVVARKV